MLTWFIRWVKGNLSVELSGRSPERFINLCRYHCIYIWNIQKIKGKYQFDVYVKDYFRLNDIAVKTCTYPYIKVKNGFPFILAWLNRRKSLAAGLILFVMTLYILSGFVWNISVSGQKRYTYEEITEYLNSINVYNGIRTSDLDGDLIEKSIRNKYNDISWVSVELKNCNVYVKLMEADVLTADNDKNGEFSNIVASSNGTVRSIVTRKGTPLVTIGDVVTKGQVLVSGIIDILNDSGDIVGKQPVYADADIDIETRYIYNNKFELEHEDKQYTGRKQHEYTLCFKNNIFSFENVLNKFESYEKYDIITEYLNNYITKKSYLEYEIVNRTYNNKEACRTAEIKLDRYIYNLIRNGINVESKNVIVKIGEGLCKSDGFVSVVEPQLMRTAVTQEDWSVDIADEHNGDSD